MLPGSFRFERFLLDPANRLLRRDGVPVELNARYLDALALLVREAGKLVSKDRFLDEVWHGVPVTDEALTQCIKTLRRQLGDSAGAPRFIETVPKHGYRFIAAVEAGGGDPAIAPSPSGKWQPLYRLGIAGTIGGGLAGVIGGLIYGFAAASQGMGAVSVLLVLFCVSTLIALLGGAGVAFGIAGAATLSPRPWTSILGGAAGGLIVGGLVKLLGLDAFALLFGQSPGDITGAPEGLAIGAAAGFAVWLSGRFVGLRRGVALAALSGGMVGIVIQKFGGQMLGGSLASLARHFPQSRLRFDQVGLWFGEPGFGPISQMVTCALEGALFAGCLVGAMILSRRRP